MTKYLTLLLIIFYLSGYSQERFYKNIPGWQSFYIAKSNTDFLSIGLSQDEFYNHHIQFTDISISGVILNQLEFFIDTCIYTSLHPNCIYKESDYFYLTSTVIYMDSVSGLYKYLGLLIKYDGVNNQVDLIQLLPKIGINCIMYCFDKCGSYYYFAGAEKPTDSVFSFVCKTDTLGNIKWKRRFRYEFPFAFETPITKPIQIVRMADEKHIVTFDSYTSYSGINKQYIACIDSAGKIVWEKAVDDNPLFYQTSLTISTVDNNNFIIAWSDPLVKTTIYPYYSFNPNTTIWAVNLDSAGNFLWKKSYREYAWIRDTQQIVHLSSALDLDGNVVLGFSFFYVNCGIIKIRPNGSVKWSRQFEIYNENEADVQTTSIYDILPLGNDGYYMACEFMATPGNTFPNTIQTGLVIKTDKYGCLEPGCQWYDHTDFELNDGNDGEETGIECMGNDDGLRIWPNPAQGLLFVETPDLPAKITMYNMNGELVKEILVSQKVTEIGLGKLPGGIYLVQVIDNGGMKTGKVVVE